MSSELTPAIEAFGLGKRYRIGGPRERYGSLRDSIGRALSSPIRAVMRRDRRPDEEIWALRDVSFVVRTGEVLGIIGRNGAGKSTLLKLLSRITDPTEGRAVVRGRVGSLLEVGTGFHPELTGRENVYLNGTILGMRRKEIDRRFEEIVSFAGTERFLDMPVKRYSSGMQVRLAFAVAAHIEAEILLVDEVLAVGDIDFQRKCIGKMQNVSRSGRTVLFVSHNLQAVKSLCSSGILLEHGRVAAHGPITTVVEAYVNSAASHQVGGALPPAAHLMKPDHFEITSVQLMNQYQQPTASLRMDEDYSLRIAFRVYDAARDYRLGVWIRNVDGTRLTSFSSTDGGLPHLRGRLGEDYAVTLRSVTSFPPGSYSFEIVAKDRFGDYVDRIDSLGFAVEPVAIGDEPELVAKSEGPVWGLVRLPSRWTIPPTLAGWDSAD